MARSRKRKSGNDKKKCAVPSESNSVRGGKPTCDTSSGVAGQDILVPEKCGFAAGSCSSVHHNNRPTSTDVVKKPCHTTKTIDGMDSCLVSFNNLVPINNSPFRRIILTVNNNIFHVDVVKERVYRDRTCIFHSIKMWKDMPQLIAYRDIKNGKIPRYMYVRPEHDHEPCDSWLYCSRCGRAACGLCAISILNKVESDDAVTEDIIKKDNWLQCVKKLSLMSPPIGHVMVLRVPPIDSHCCRLGKCIRINRNKCKRARHAQLKKNKINNTGNKEPASSVHAVSKKSPIRAVCSNDGYLHYAPYRAVFKPSFRYYESLCAAQQGKKGTVNYQDAVYHSVISNELAQTYDAMGVFPEGPPSQVILHQKFFYIDLPSCFGGSRYVPKAVLIRKVLLRYSSDYVPHPKNGTCPLSNAHYFNSCLKMLDETWEDEDIKNGVFCCLVTGQPSPKDRASNEILLCCRIYDKEYMIPSIDDSRRNDFLQSCFSSAGKSGFENRRLGGSAGTSEATTEQLRYFSNYRACYPVLAGSVFHLPMQSGIWRSYYITPYRGPNVSDAAAMHHYSTPKPGGAIEWKKEIDSLYPYFFERMSKNRYMTAIVLELLFIQHAVDVSPVARRNQLEYNQIADSLCCSKGKEIHQEMCDQVVYSLVPYTVGLHRDVTKNGVSQELVECKACLAWPAKFMDVSKCSIALGRGGLGYGKFTVMIVDHPKKSSS